MSVLIKGMEMPESCHVCEVGNSAQMFGHCPFYDLKTDQDAWGTQRHPDCPLVPVPPHGRLIDTSAKVQTQLYDDEHEEWSDEITMTVEEYLGYCFNEVPTIIEAEEEHNAGA